MSVKELNWIEDEKFIEWIKANKENFFLSPMKKVEKKYKKGNK